MRRPKNTCSSSSLLLAALLFSGCSLFKDSGQRASPSEIQEVLRTIEEYLAIAKAAEQCVVDSRDGIDEVEAYKIAKDYLVKTGRFRENGIHLPIDAGEMWHVLSSPRPDGGYDVLLEVGKKDGTLTERQPNQALQTTSVTRSGFGKVAASEPQRRGV